MTDHEQFIKNEFVDCADPDHPDRIEAEKMFQKSSIELTDEEAELYRQHSEIEKRFQVMCERKLAQQDIELYNVVSEIYGIFVKYGIVNEDTSADTLAYQILRTKNGGRTTFTIYVGSYRFCYWIALPINKLVLLAEQDVKPSVDMSRRIGLVNGALPSYEAKFKKAFYRKE
jgi:hypothetical protein